MAFLRSFLSYNMLKYGFYSSRNSFDYAYLFSCFLFSLRVISLEFSIILLIPLFNTNFLLAQSAIVIAILLGFASKKPVLVQPAFPDSTHPPLFPLMPSRYEVKKVDDFIFVHFIHFPPFIFHQKHVQLLLNVHFPQTMNFCSEKSLFSYTCFLNLLSLKLDVHYIK